MKTLVLAALLVGPVLAEARPVSTLGVKSRSRAEPAFVSRHLLVGTSRDLADVVGRWTMTVAAETPYELTLEVATTPSCDSGLAVFYTSADGAQVGIEPAGGKDGVFFAFDHGGKRYLADLRVDGAGRLSGDVADFETDARQSAKAVYLDAETRFTMRPVTASLNSTSLELETDEGETKLFVRSPSITNTRGDVVFHRATPKYFACYGLDAEGGSTAFTYSEAALFTVVLTDLAATDAAEVWKFDEGKAVRLQKDPFILSVASDSGSVDLFARVDK